MKKINIIFFLIQIISLLWNETYAIQKEPNRSTISSILIKNAEIVDGTGSNSFRGSVRIVEDRITEIGNLAEKEHEEIVDAEGLTLAPGFIDAHSHHFGLLKDDPSSIATANQGITTIVIGQDGDSYYIDSLEKSIQKNPIGVNVCSYTGHSFLRELVMGEKNLLRTASPLEIDKMRIILEKELEKGSLGLSTGLEYEAAFYSSPDEVLQLAKILSGKKRRYISHIRSEDISMDKALDEIINIGRIANIPVQISHIKIAKKDNWHTASRVLEKLNNARKEGIHITADVYPYNFWNSTMRVLFPDHNYTSLKSAEFAVDQLFDARSSVLVNYAPFPLYKGKTIYEISLMRKESPAHTLMYLIDLASEFKTKNPNYNGSIEAIAGKSMSDDDVTDFILWKHSVICSDGNGGGHPRGYGSFTRILNTYVREQKKITLPVAIHKMTGLTAEYLGIQKRGVITVGYYADLVLFDPNQVKDNATIHNSHLLSSGILMVWINGKNVYKNKKSIPNLSGVFIKAQ